MGYGDDVVTIKSRIVEIGTNPSGHLRHALTPVRAGILEIMRPGVNFMTGDIIPATQFPSAEIEFHQPGIDVKRAIEQYAQLLSQRATSRQGTGVDTPDRVWKRLGELAQALKVESTSRNVGTPVADTGRNLRFAVPQKGQRHATMPR